MTRIPVGTFINESGRFAVSDPCYDVDVWCRGELENVKTGTWNAEVNTTDASAKWGVRVARLAVVHDSYDDAEGDLAENVAMFDVGVDSGQAGIFDASHYRDDSVLGEEKSKFNEQYGREGGPGEEWYGICCDRTLSEKPYGVIPFGAVSQSGFGDGGYGCIYYTDPEGLIVKVEIIFICEEQDDEDDEPDSADDGRKYTHCAKCGAELWDEYYMYRDNFLQLKYFDEQDGSDNAFCSESCAAEALMLENVENVREG